MLDGINSLHLLRSVPVRTQNIRKLILTTFDYDCEFRL